MWCSVEERKTVAAGCVWLISQRETLQNTGNSLRLNPGPWNTKHSANTSRIVPSTRRRRPSIKVYQTQELDEKKGGFVSSRECQLYNLAQAKNLCKWRSSCKMRQFTHVKAVVIKPYKTADSSTWAQQPERQHSDAFVVPRPENNVIWGLETFRMATVAVLKYHDLNSKR